LQDGELLEYRFVSLDEALEKLTERLGRPVKQAHDALGQML
jgi:hypothetical protein